MAVNVNVGLALHWPRVTDIGSSPPMEEGDEQPTSMLLATLPFPLYCALLHSVSTE